MRGTARGTWAMAATISSVSVEAGMTAEGFGDGAFHFVLVADHRGADRGVEVVDDRAARPGRSLSPARSTSPPAQPAEPPPESRHRWL